MHEDCCSAEVDDCCATAAVLNGSLVKTTFGDTAVTATKETGTSILRLF